MRLLAFGLCALSASAQSHLVDRPGPVVALDVASGPFPALTPAGTDVSGSLGWRLGRGVDLALIVGRGGAVSDTLFPYPAEWHLGLEAAVALGGARRWRLAAVANATVAGSNTFVFPTGGGPTRVPSDRSVLERRARVSVTRYVPLAQGRVRVLAGLGAYGALRQIEPYTLVFDAGGPNERVNSGEPLLETSVGLVVGLPIAVRLSPRAELVLDSELRADLYALLFGASDGRVTLRLNL